MSATGTRPWTGWSRCASVGAVLLMLAIGPSLVRAQPAPAEQRKPDPAGQAPPVDELPPDELPEATKPEATPPPVLPVLRPMEPPPPMPELSLLAGDTLTRLAITGLREIPSPSREDYRMTALAFRVAQRLRPQNLELLRLELDAWAAAGDEDRVLEITSQLIRLDPQDTIAQLRLIVSRIGRLQDADQRMSAYDRLLGAEGKSLDASIRSRLALDAALLARETGDEQGFVTRLTMATTLDVTNKTAAALYATYFLDRTNDPKERAEILGNIILADPCDPGPYTNLALELMRRGAYSGAKRFYERAGDLQQAAGVILSTEDIFDRILCLWMTEGDDAAQQRLEAVQAAEQSVLAAERRQKISAGFDPGPIVEALLPPLLENLRLAMAFARGDADAMAESARHIYTKYEEELGYVQQRTQGYENLTEEEAQRTLRATRLKMALACLWGNFRVEDAQDIMARMNEAPEGERPDERALQRFDGLMAFRTGDAARAVERLAPLAENDPAARLGLAMAMEVLGRAREAKGHYAALARDHTHTALGAGARKRIETMLARELSVDAETVSLEGLAAGSAPAGERPNEAAPPRLDGLSALRGGDADRAATVLAPLAEDDPGARLGLGVALERLGRTEEAKQNYRSLARDHGNTTIGAAARKRIETLKRAELSLTAAASALESFASGFAPWLDDLTSAPHAFMSVTAHHVTPRIDVFGRGDLVLRVRNTSRWPLALGPEQPINSTFMLTPRVMLAGREITGAPSPEIVTLDRRLRLNPGEEISVPIWALRGSTGLFLEISAIRIATVRWRVLQGYRLERVGQEQHYRPGPMTIVTESDLLSRDGLADQPDPEALARSIATAQDRELMESILLAAVTGVRRREGVNEESAAETRRRLAIAIVERWPTLNDYQRVYALAVGLRGGLVETDGPLEAVAKDDSSPFVRAVLMLGPFRTAAHRERVARIAENSDPDVREMARALSRRLEQETREQGPAPPPEPAEESR